MEHSFLWAKVDEQEAEIRRLTEQQNVLGTNASMLKTTMDLMVDENKKIDTKFERLEARIKTNEQAVYLHGGILSDTNHALEDAHSLCEGLDNKVEELGLQQFDMAIDVCVLETRLNFPQNEKANEDMELKYRGLEARVEKTEGTICLHEDLLVDVKQGVEGAHSLYDGIKYNFLQMARYMNDMTNAVDTMFSMVEVGATKVVTNAYLLEATMAVVQALAMGNPQGDGAPGSTERRHAAYGGIVDYVTG